MRIPYWNPELKPQPQDIVQAILNRRGGEFINLDRALLWSEPLARGWNTYLRAVRSDIAVDRCLRELAICTVALTTGAMYEYHHHAPDYLAAGGAQVSLDSLPAFIKSGVVPAASPLTADEALVVQYAWQMTKNIRVNDDIFSAMKTRFDTTELVEITASIATYNMVARFLVALEVSEEVR